MQIITAEFSITLEMKETMGERMNPEPGKKEKLSPIKEVTRLRSEEYLKDQKELQLLLIKDEKALNQGSAILKNRNVLNEKSADAVRRMMKNKMDTFPENEDVSHAAAIKDPREIIKQLDVEWEDYNRHYREDAAQALEKISNFCKKWELDFNPYFCEDISAKKLWRELQKAYHARLFEMQSGFEDEPDLHAI